MADFRMIMCTNVITAVSPHRTLINSTKPQQTHYINLTGFCLT